MSGPTGETIPDLSGRYSPDVLEQLSAYSQLLAGPGVEWGLIGPREVPRLWTRHLLNCAVVADPGEQLVPASARVIDVGSGSGLPGLVWAIVRPDLALTLIEPLARRVQFLDFAIAELGLAERVTVLRDRAETAPPGVAAEIVTARAVAPLPKLGRWLLPLTTSTGTVLALKGASARAEVRSASRDLRKAGARRVEVVECGTSWLEVPTTVVIIGRSDLRGGGT